MKWSEFDRYAPAVRVLTQEHLIITRHGWYRGYPVLNSRPVSWPRRIWDFLVASLEGRN